MPRISERPNAALKFLGFLKTDLSRIVNEYEAYNATLPPNTADREEKLTSWRNAKAALVQTKLVAAKNCQEYVKVRDRVLAQVAAASAQRFKEERRAYFELKATSLDPPLDPPLDRSELETIPGYIKSLETRRQPTDRSWLEILAKVKEQRFLAKQESELPAPFVGLIQDPNAEIVITAQTTLLASARQICQELHKDGVAPEDFVYLALRGVREMFYTNWCTKPKLEEAGSEPEASLEPEEHTLYRLCMGDARHVYKKVIEPSIRYWSDPEKQRKAFSVYCPGCKRKDYRKPWEFCTLIEHLKAAHSEELSSPWRIYKRADAVTNAMIEGVQWRAIPWPRNMPLCGPHHKATGKWDPNEKNYERSPPKPASYPSAFENRIVRPRKPESDSAVQHMIDALLEAATKLRESPMSPQFKARIVWDYGMQSLQQFGNATQQLISKDLDMITAALIRAGEFALFSKVGCASWRPSHAGEAP